MTENPGGSQKPPGRSLKSRRHDGLDGVHPVFRFVEDDGLRPLKDLVSHLHAIDAELVVNLTANGGVQVVEGGETVEEPALASGLLYIA